MVIGVTNFEAQVITQLEQTLLGLGGTIPAAVQPGNFQERLLQLLAAIALRLGVIVPAAAVPGNPDARLLQLLVAIALTLGGSVLVVSGFEYQVLNQLEQILVGLGGTLPVAVQPGNYSERFLQLLRAIAARSSLYSPAPVVPSSLTWTAQNSASYSYYDAGSMLLLHDGILTGVGMFVTSSGNVFVHARLNSPRNLSGLRLWSGQIFGTNHSPLLMELYSGFVTAAGTPLYTCLPQYVSFEQVFNFPASISGQDFTVRLQSETGLLGAFELQLYGT